MSTCPSPFSRHKSVNPPTTWTLFICSGLLLLAGCVGSPALLSKNAAVPAGTDLSGHWLLREDPTAIRPPDFRDAVEPIIRTDRKERRDDRRRGTVAQAFLELGDALKISQTDFSLFISYDRAVVEEYTFGENREVTIGPIEAQRVSGWEGNTFVVETLDSDGSVLFESWQLENDDAVLVRNIRIASGEKTAYSVKQFFDRK